MLLFPLFSLFSSTVAFGPATHAVISCSAPSIASRTSNSGDLAGCARYPTTLALVDTPDAFAFGKFNISSDDCVNAAQLHDPLFGGFVLASLANGTVSPPKGLSQADATTGMAIFTSHMLGDLVGFHPGGALCFAPDLTGGCTQNGIDYLLMWKTMSAVDGLLLAGASLSYADFVPPASLPLQQWDLYLRMITDASKLYASFTPTFTAVPLATAQACSHYWNKNVGPLVRIASLTDVATLTSELSVMTHGVLHAENVATFLEAQRSCGTAAVEQFVGGILANPATDVPALLAATASTVASSYSAGKCGSA
mmetsp:Transcript_13875/g.43670  ORF Transcript_13875/g.43670 Transcript_13875/m.43670 type:complete len:310 (-) Transcript_13875:500-1429(-)